MHTRTIKPASSAWNARPTSTVKQAQASWT
jgi:hypothetical protein